MVQRKIIGLACSLVLLAPLALRGQVVAIKPRPRPTLAEETTPKANIRVDTNLVLVPVTVCDPLNRP
jgi:Ca-activated chloride channel family protein